MSAFFCWKYSSRASLLLSIELIKSIDVPHLINTLRINARRWLYAFSWNFHNMINFLFDSRKLITISCAFYMIVAKNENFMISFNNSCKSWLSQETKNTCFIWENFAISAHKPFIVKQVFVIIQLILHGWLLIVFIQSFITHSAWTAALIFSATSIIAFKWKSLSFEVADEGTWQHRLITLSFRMLTVSSVKKLRYLQAFSCWSTLIFIVSYISSNSLSFTSLRFDDV